MEISINKGDILAGRFRVERVLGSGAMGVVVAAFHLQLDQLVALKFLLPDAAKNPEVVERFAREARAAVRIESEHVARVLDVGELDARPYIVMEYLEGENLEQLLARNGPLSIGETARYMLEACDAVAEAHGLGIVHRDLKPSNMFVAERVGGGRTIKVLDFGILKSLPNGIDPPQASLTRTSALMGSPAYMAPEQLRCSRDVDARADIWSLGVVLYEMLCGVRPFWRGNVAEVCAAILKEGPTPPRQLRAELPTALEAVVLRCLEKDAGSRYANIAELASELLLFAPPGAERSIERISRVLRPADAKSLRRGELGATDVASVRDKPIDLDPAVRASSSDSQADPFAATKLEPDVALTAEAIETGSAPTAASPRLDTPRWFSTVVLFGASALFAVGTAIFVWTVVSSEGAGAEDRAAASDEPPLPEPRSLRVEPPATPGVTVGPSPVERPTPVGATSASAPPTSSAPEATAVTTKKNPELDAATQGAATAMPSASVALPGPGAAATATSTSTTTRTTTATAPSSSASVSKPRTSTPPATPPGSAIPGGSASAPAVPPEPATERD